jgi:predicted dehydrogenase
VERKTSIAVMGAGDYATRYHIPHLAANPRADLVALCSRTQESVARSAARFGVRGTYTDYRQLLDRERLEAVVVSSPHAVHYEQCRAALRHGLHVLVDKHMVMRCAEWRELMATAAERGLVLMPALNRHLDSGNLRARDLIRSGEMGEVYFARSLQVGYPVQGYFTSLHYSGGGPFTGRSSHMAALVPWLTGWRPAEVQALATHEPGGEVEASGIINVRFTGGQLLQISSIKSGYRFVDEVELVGTSAALRVANRGAYTPWEPVLTKADGVPQSLPGLSPTITTTDHFLDVIRGEAANRLPAEDGLLNSEIVEASYESVRTGQTIRLRWE